MNIIKEINENNNNKLYNLNISYLNNLDNNLKILIDFLNKIKIDLKQDIENNNYFEKYNLKIDKSELVNLTNFILSTNKNIHILLKNVPDYKNNTENKKICDEYYKFHNCIINNIKKFINYYNNYVIKLNKIYEEIIKMKQIHVDEVNNEITKYNNNLNIAKYSHYAERDIEISTHNFNLVYKPLIRKIEIYDNNINYICKEIDLFYSIKKITKNINIDFLVELKKNAYNK